MDLVDYIVNKFPDVGPSITEFGNKSPVKRRRHPANILCTRIGKHMHTGTITVQHAPDLFCTPEELLDILLESGTGRTGYDTGVTVIHLVRNPFSMAVSNYHYHAQIPSPEEWVLDQDPCDIDYHEDKITDTFADMVLPTLSKASYASLNLEFDGRLMLPRDFDAIRQDCLSLYQTRAGLEDANFLTHLMNYDPPEGLRLATAEMMIQGLDNGGDILRMANNIIKLKQAQMKLLKSHKYQETKKELHVYTLSLEDFIARPAESAHKFFDFVLNASPADPFMHERIDLAARMHWQHYHDKVIENSNHVTHDKTGDGEQLKEYLRQNTLFGPTLSKIESLVEAALMEGQSKDEQ